LKHYASSDFWTCFETLPDPVKELARKNYALLKETPHHPSLHLKQIKTYSAVRIGLHYRALGVHVSDGILWFWIGTHTEYDKLLSR
jgi:hypothetical protein